jgi:hypothetical protein
MIERVSQEYDELFDLGIAVCGAAAAQPIEVTMNAKASSRRNFGREFAVLVWIVKRDIIGAEPFF